MKILLLIISLIGSSLYGGELRITGTVVSDNQKMIGARYMGYIKKIHFDIGDFVKREDTLYELESAEFDILKNQADLALEQAQIMVNMYRTRIDSIRREQRMVNKLKKKGFDIEDLDTVSSNAEAGLASAQVLVKNAATKIKQVATIANYLKVKAPNDGIIVQKRIRVGDFIAPGMLAMVLVDLKHLEVEAQISESDLSKIRKRDSVEVTISSIGAKMKGVVKSIVPAMNPMTHSFSIRVSFKNDNDKIFPGMYSQLRIKYKDR